jgi:hypothetical protein
MDGLPGPDRSALERAHECNIIVRESNRPRCRGRSEPDSTEIVKNWRQIDNFVQRPADFAEILQRNRLKTSGFQKNFT